MDDKDSKTDKLQKNYLLLQKQLETERNRKIYYQTQLKNLLNAIKDITNRLELAWKNEVQKVDTLKQHFGEMQNLLLKHNNEINELQQKIGNVLMCNENKCNINNKKRNAVTADIIQINNNNKRRKLND